MKKSVRLVICMLIGVILFSNIWEIKAVTAPGSYDCTYVNQDVHKEKDGTQSSHYDKQQKANPSGGHASVYSSHYEKGICAGCGYVFNKDEVINSNEVGHTRECNVCEDEYLEKHIFKEDSNNTDYHVCAIDGCSYREKHTFEINGSLLQSPEKHMLVCKCGALKAEEHDFKVLKHISPINIQDIPADGQNMHMLECVCGAEKEVEHEFEVIVGGATPPGKHLLRCECLVEKYEKHWSPFEGYERNSEKHWQVCVCGEEFNSGNHKDEDNDGKCDTCDKPLDNKGETYCEQGCTSWHYTDGTAYNCHAECEGGHVKWVVGKHSGTPTCTEKKTCTICGRMYWLDHNYVDGKCTMCGAEQPTEPTPTEPAPIEEPPVTPTPTLTPPPTSTPGPTPSGNWQKDVYYHWQPGGEKELHKPIPATCTQPISCVCGAYVGKPKGHKYNDKDVCTVCGAIKGSEPESSPAPIEKNVSFNDVNPGDWYYDNGSIKYVTDNGYIEESSSNNFAPDEDMTRERFIKMLYNVEGRPKVSDEDILEIYKEFNDIKNGHDLDAIVWGRKNNIMNGMSDGRFGTDEGISRQQMAVALKRYVEYRGEDTSKRADLTKFSDYKDVYNWAEEALSWAVASGIINGSDGKLLPQANATRAQVATMITNYLTK